MDLAYFDINPGILGLIIWGLISYFTNRKKNNNADKGNSREEHLFGLDSFRGILDPQNKIDFSKSNIDEINFEDLEENKETDNLLDIPLETEDIDYNHYNIDRDKDAIRRNNKLLKIFRNKNSLRSAFIIKEIIDKPVSLKNNE